MALRKRPIAAGIAALLFSGYVSALGLGEIKLNSALNEPLDAEIPLLNLGELSDAEIIAGLASQNDFDNAKVERDLLLTGLVFNLDLEAPGGPVIRVFSQKPIREPYLDFLVDVQWPTGRVLREYTLLLDMPVYAGGTFAKKKPKPQVTQASSRSAASAPAEPSSSATWGQQQAIQNLVAGAEQYTIREGDTLWRIASRLPGEYSVHQRMADIQQLNPSAFINGDMNLIKKGAVLRFPDYAVGGISATAVSIQGQAAADGAAPLSGSSRQVASNSAVDSSGRLSLSARDGQSGQGTALGSTGVGTSELRGEIDNIQDELDKSRRENVELRQRLSSLEDQLATMQRLIQLEDDDLRAAQLSSAASDSSAATGNDVSQAAEPIFDEEPNAGVATTDAIQEEAESTEPEESQSLALFPSANVGAKSTSHKPEASKASAGESLAAVPGGAPGVDAPSADDSLANATIGSDDKKPESEGSTHTGDTAKSVASPVKIQLTTEKGWFEKVNGYLMLLIGILVVAIGGLGAYVLRKKKGASQPEVAPTFEKPAVRVTPRPTPAPVEPVVQRHVPTASIDEIDLKAGDDLFESVAEAPVARAPVAPMQPATPSPAALDDDVELDLSEFDLDELSPDAPAPARAASSADQLNLDEEFDFLGDLNEGDTQLELAEAYLEMGDQAGAKEILLEVAEEGSDDQKARARAMLDKMA